MDVVRKRSPRAPSIALDEALNRALLAYDKDRTHAAPAEVVAQNLGYKSANNGSALAAMASLRYYGLLERPKEGMLAVAKSVEQYKFAPDKSQRKALLRKFLLAPNVFAELLEFYRDGLPSDATIRYELINRGFLPAPAETCAAVFRKSVDFVDYFGQPGAIEPTEADDEGANIEDGPRSRASNLDESDESVQQPTVASFRSATPRQSASPLPPLGGEDVDSIPVRLTGGRRAWLVIPHRLYDADKVRLKAQIDLLLTVEEEQGNS